ncbi:MAG: cysteine hydrolase family protein [Myxococcota bacterium]
MSTESCVTFTANDAYLRGYSLVVLEDACASANDATHRHAMRQLKQTLMAQIAHCRDINFVRRNGALDLRIAQAR